MQWYVGSQGQQSGPFSQAQLRMMVQSGIFRPTDLAWREGMTEWAPLGGLDLAEPLPPAPLDPEMAARRPVDLDRTAAADPWVRLLAAVIDGLAAVMCLGPGLAMLRRELLQMARSGAAEFTPTIGTGLVVLAAGALVLTVVQIGMLVMRGQTIGKSLCNVRIVRAGTGELPGFLRVVVLRSWVPGFLGAVPCLGSIFTLTNILFILRPDRRCLHDHLAGTVVVWARVRTLEERMGL